MRWTMRVGAVWVFGFVSALLIAFLGPFGVPLILAVTLYGVRLLRRDPIIGESVHPRDRYLERQRRTLAQANPALERLGMSASIDRSFRADERGWLAAASRELVRSRSEAVLADRFIERGMDFCYEPRLLGRDGTIVHPDFMVIDGEGNEAVVLLVEYLGMLDDPAYQRSWERKRAWYANQGIPSVADAEGSTRVALLTINGTMLWGTPWRERRAA